jgi:hypothetical protein
VGGRAGGLNPVGELWRLLRCEWRLGNKVPPPKLRACGVGNVLDVKSFQDLQSPRDGTTSFPAGLPQFSSLVGPAFVLSWAAPPLALESQS